jgi:hypothetical protein
MGQVTVQVPLRSVQRFLYGQSLLDSLDKDWPSLLRIELQPLYVKWKGKVRQHTGFKTLVAGSKNKLSDKDQKAIKKWEKRIDAWNDMGEGDLEEIIPDGTRVNVRLDSFNFDPLPHFKDGGSFIPWPEDVMDYETSMGGAAGRKGGGGGAETTERPIRVSSRECVKLWVTLKDEKFAKIVKANEPHKAWDKIIKTLDQDRQESQEKQEDKYVDLYQWSTRMLRPFTSKDPKSVVILGDDPAEEGISLESLDPQTLFEKLKTIEERAQRGLDISRRNLKVCNEVVSELREKLGSLQKDTKDLTKVFRRLSIPTSIEPKEDSLTNFFDTWKSLNDHSEIRSYHENIVSKPKGTIRKFSYQELVGEGVLSEVPNEESTTFCGLGLGDLGQFLQNLHVAVLTTSSPKFVSLKFVYNEKDVLTDTLVGLKSLKESKEELTIRYSPLGDEVPIRDDIEFKFDSRELYTFLMDPGRFNRPRQIIDLNTHIQNTKINELLLNF